MMRFVAGRLAVILGLALAVIQGSGATAQDIRERQRKLFILDAHAGFKIDGRSTPAFQKALGDFAVKHGVSIQNEGEIDARLDQEVRKRRDDLLKPFTEPVSFDRPAMSKGYPAVEISPQDNMLFGGNCVDIARYKLDTGIPLQPFKKHGAGIHFVHNSARKEFVCIASWDTGGDGLLILNSETGMKKDYIPLPGPKLIHGSELKISADGRKTYVLTNADVLVLDNASRSFRKIASINSPFYPQSITASDDDGIVAVGVLYAGAGRGYETRVYDARDGRLLITLPKISEFVLSNDGRLLFSGDSDQFAVRDVRSGRVLASNLFEDSRPYVRRRSRNVVFDVGNRSILFVTENDSGKKLLNRWEFHDNKLSKVSEFENSGAENWIDPAGGTVYTYGDDGVVAYALLSGQQRTSLAQTARSTLASTAVSPAGEHIFVVNGRGGGWAINLTTGQARDAVDIGMTLSGRVLGGGQVAAFQDETRVIVGGSEGKIIRLNIETNAIESVIEAPDYSISTIAISRSRRLLATTGSTHANGKLAFSVRVYDLSSRKLLYRHTSSDLIDVAGFADNDRRIVFGEKLHVVVSDIATSRTVLRQQVKGNLKTLGKRTTWNWGSMKWIMPQQDERGAVLIGMGGAIGHVYEYAGERLVLRKGNVNDGPASNWALGNVKHLARAEDGRLVVLHGLTPKTTRLSDDSWLTQHNGVEGLPIGIEALPRGRFVAVSDAGILYVYESEQTEPVLTVVLGSHGNWLSRIKGGYFAGTRGAAENLFFALSSKDTITIDSLYDTLYRPDLVALQSSPRRAEKEPDIAPKVAIEDLVKEGLPPRVTLVGSQEGAVAQEENATVGARIAVASGGIGRIEWRVNGVTRLVTKSAQGRDGDTITLEESLLLEAGQNEVEVVAFNAANRVSSLPAKIKYTLAGPPSLQKPRLFILSIGINDYWDSRLKLSFATTDAVTLAAKLEEAGKDFFESVHSWVVTDQQATKSGIASKFDEISHRIRSTDVFILFVAGHGKTDAGKYYFIPHDMKYSGPSSFLEQGISQSDWQDWMARVAARKSLLMFDTCESGTLTIERMTRGFDRLAALERLTRATGRSVLAAASDDGPALEGFEGHGVFAYSVLEGLAAADPNRTGLIQVASLASYVGNRVPELSHGKFGIRQVPQMKLIGEDFPIGRTVAALERSDEQFIPHQPTHVLLTATRPLDAEGKAMAGEQFSPGSLVRVVRSREGLSEVARSGRKIGFFKSSDLAPMQ